MSTTNVTTPASTSSEKHKANFFDGLYTGEGGFEFIKHSKTWYAITGALLVISLLSMLIRGFGFSIDFEGGTKVSMPAGDLTVEQVEQSFTEATGVTPELVQIVGAGDSRTLEVNATRLTEEQSQEAQLAIAGISDTDDLEVGDIGVSNVSESWGSTITNRMIVSMLVFLVFAGAYVAIRLQRDMAAASLIALVIDGILIAGIYSIFGLEVSPAVVIGLLTVLTFSIYDTVVVFDKVKENTAGVLDSRRATYGEQANLAVNQTIMRSLSTSIISALPIVALFVIAVWMLGIGTLRDLAVIQLIGVVEGLLSSLFLATPLLVSIVSRKREVREHDRAVAEFRANGGKVDLTIDTEDPTAGLHKEKRRVVTPVDDAATETSSTWRPR